MAAPGRAPLVLADSVLSVAQMLVFVISGFFILRWIYRANQVAQALTGGEVAISPGWNVGWFFVPIANLWKPFDGVRQSYQACVDPNAPYGVAVPQSMRLWWGFWIATNLVSNVAFRIQMQMGADTPANILYGIAECLASRTLSR